MITEKRFASMHGAFWHELLPTASDYIRRRNLALERFDVPLGADTSAARGILNETAFRLFGRAVANGCRVAALDQEAVSEAVRAATEFVSRFRSHSREVEATLSENEIIEARELAKRLRSFFAGEGTATLWPRFPGCGWLDSCEGDVLVGTCLYEVKSREGRFNSLDVRQILAYLALAQAAGGPTIHDVALVNPRDGVVLRDSVDVLCIEAGGAASSELLEQIVTYVSEPLWVSAEET